jgi:hypothetical protein
MPYLAYISNKMFLFLTGEKTRWNAIHAVTNPPACAEILPWILKINELMQERHE